MNMENFRQFAENRLNAFKSKYFKDNEKSYKLSIYFIYSDIRGKVVIDLNTVISCLENNISKEILMEYIDFIIIYDDKYDESSSYEYDYFILPYTRVTIEEFITGHNIVNLIKKDHEKRIEQEIIQQVNELESWVEDNVKNKTIEY